MDVNGFLEKLKTMAFLTGGVQDPFLALQVVLKRLAGVDQGREETADNIRKRFLAQTQVLLSYRTFHREDRRSGEDSD